MTFLLDGGRNYAALQTVTNSAADRTARHGLGQRRTGSSEATSRADHLEHRQPSRRSLISQAFLKGPAADADARRRVKRSKTNHLHPDRRRCFYLAIPLTLADLTLTDVYPAPPNKLWHLRRLRTRSVTLLDQTCMGPCAKGAANLQRFRLRRCSPGAHALRCSRRAATRRWMNNNQALRVRSAIARLPDWLRRDLSSKDDANRQRAEEALSAMLVSAIEE